MPATDVEQHACKIVMQLCQLKQDDYRTLPLRCTANCLAFSATLRLPQEHLELRPISEHCTASTASQLWSGYCISDGTAVKQRCSEVHQIVAVKQ